MRRAWLPIVLIAILPAVAGFADEANTVSNVDSKVISELGEKALAHLQRQYPQIDAGRFTLISTTRLPANSSADTAAWFTYADKATIKRLRYQDGQRTSFVQFFKDHYTVRIRLDGVVVGVDEEHFTDKQIIARCLPDFDGRVLTLPKTLMGYWN